MAAHKVLKFLANLLIASTVCACSTIGPATVKRDRIDYGSAIGDSWKQQTLLNIVKLRYGDMPMFLEIAQVVAGYQVETTAGASVNAGGPVNGPLVLGGSLAGQSKYIDRPTVIYAPLTGTDFLKRLMTPIPPSAVLFTLQSGYPADLIFPVAVNSINGISNESKRGMSQVADPQFALLVQLLREAQLGDALQIRIERGKNDFESTIIAFPPGDRSLSASKSQEIARILRLNPELREFRVTYGGYSGRKNEISMVTRSMLQILLELGATVQVPASDLSTGKAAPGAAVSQGPDTRGAPLVNILSGDSPPPDAFVATQYNGHWFWIKNTDIRSKYAFGFVMLLFSLSDVGPKGAAPIVTVPTN